MRQYARVWEFTTTNTRVVLEVSPCEDDPADHFDFQEDVDAVRNGNVDWFDACVRVFVRGVEMGADYLGCCSYDSAAEFLSGHRDANPLNRNCSIMRASRGDNVVICHYFPDMVRQAVHEARRELDRLQSVHLRKSA
jgi:hypothetical protein